MKKLCHNRKGFTLIEIIVVVVIIAILAAVAVPSFLGLTDRAKQGVEIAYATHLAEAINLYNSDHNSQIAGAPWSSQSDINGALGDLSVQCSDETLISNAAGRLQFDGKAVTVDTDFR